MSKHKIDLKDMLSALDMNDKDFYSKLSDEQKKDFSAWTSMRFASSCQGTNSEHYLIFINEIVNRDFSALSSHPELQWKLLALCGSGKKEYHPWLTPPKRVKKDKIYEFISNEFPDLKDDDIEHLRTINTTDDIKQFARDSGYSNDEIKKIFGKK